MERMYYKAAEERDAAIDHLRNVLYAMMGMPSPVEMCRAIEDALAFYNAQRPDAQIDLSR